MWSIFLSIVPHAAAVAATPLGSAASALVHVPTRTASRASSPLLAIGSRGSSTAEDPYEVLRAGYDRSQLTSFFMKRPVALMGRAAKFARVYKKLQRVWLREEALPAAERTRGNVLRQEISALGPVAVKLGQTLSQRPDIVGVDVCEALKSLQTSNAPFDNERAWQVLREELGARGRPIAPGPTFVDGTTDPNAPPVFARLSEQPIASASLGQVYRGQTHDGREVAVLSIAQARMQSMVAFAGQTELAQAVHDGGPHGSVGRAAHGVRDAGARQRVEGGGGAVGAEVGEGGGEG
jgi:hypothetical protein